MNQDQRSHRIRLPLAILMLAAAMWLQVAQPLLLAGHLAACAADAACGGTCRHEAAAGPFLAAQPEAPAAAGHEHDPLHCVLCRTVQLAGKALSFDGAPACGPDSPARTGLPPVATPPVAAPEFCGSGPRAPPSC